MHKLHNSVLLASLIVVAALSACNNKDAAEKTSAVTEQPAVVVATVNGTSISKELFEVYSKQRSAVRPNANTPADQKAAIEDLINRELIYQDALKRGLDKDASVTADFENLKRNILANLAVRKQLEANAPTEEAMQKEYQTTIGKMGAKEYKARHILVKTQQEAKDIIAQLDKGADFATLAKEKSLDGSASNGGDLGWFDQSAMVKPFFDGTAALKKGKYTKTAVQSEFGWHIILLDDTRDFTPPKFEDVKDRIRGTMVTNQVKEYLAQLKSQAKIDIKDTATTGTGEANPQPK